MNRGGFMPASITSINAYIKRQKLTQQARERMKNFSGGAPDAKAAQEAKDAKQTGIAGRINVIANKLKAGKKLSGAELSYLRKHSPDLYEKAIKIAREREGYRRSLDKAKTKDQADRVHMEKQQQLYTEAKQTGADSESLAMRNSAILDERLDYIKHGNYRKLKQEHEIRQKQ